MLGWERVLEDSELIREEYEKRISTIFQQHNPQKLANLQTLLNKYSGKEHSLYMKICTKYREPKLRKYRPPKRDEAVLLEQDIIGPELEPPISPRENPEPSEIDEVGFLNEKLSKQEAEIEDLRATLEGMRSANQRLEKETYESARKILDAMRENMALKLELKEKSERLCLADEKIDGLEMQKADLEKRFSELHVPPVMTVSNLQIFSAKELRKQDTLLCKLMMQIAGVREDILELLEDDKMCKICFERKKRCVLNPCGHTYCESCAQRVSHCAFCKTPKSGIIKIFW